MRYIWLVGVAAILILLSNPIVLSQNCNITGTWANKDGSWKLQFTPSRSGNGSYDGVDQKYMVYLHGYGSPNLVGDAWYNQGSVGTANAVDALIRAKITGPACDQLSYKIEFLRDKNGAAIDQMFNDTFYRSAATTALTNNNQLGHASAVVSGQAVKQGITPAGTLNWYKFHASANGMISISIDDVPKDMRPDVTLYDKNFNNFMEKSATSPGDKLSFKTDIPKPGWVYIAVKDADGKAHSEQYTLTVNFDAVQDSYDPNNVLGDAAEIKPGTAIKASICPHGELDWYKFKAGANGIVSVNVEGVPSDMRPDVTLYDKNFNKFEEKSATSPGGSLKFTRDIPTLGWVYIAVSDADGKAHSDPYTLTINFDAVQDSYDPNNVLGDAAEIKPGEAIKAAICPHGELDWYKLQANAGGIISVNVNVVPKDMRPGASLYDKNFNRFEDKQATNAGDSLSFDKDLPAPGWAYIAVYDADGKAHSDPYTLTATLKSG